MNRPSGGRALGWAAGGALLALAAVLPALLPQYWLTLATMALIMAIFAASVNLIAGYGGMVTLGQGGILAVSAYGVAYTAIHSGLGYGMQVLVAFGAVIVVSAVFGAMAVRASGVYFLMVTLAQGMVIWGLAYSLPQTGGADGIPNVSRPPWLAGHTDFYYVCLGAVVLVLALIAVFVRSPFGLGMRAIKANEPRARSLGYNTTLHRFLGFMASGLVAGFAGILFVYQDGYIDPSASYFQMSADGMVMALVGGLGTTAGPVVGAAVLIVIQNVVSNYIERWPTVEGLIFIVIVLYARQGLVGLAKDGWSRLARYRAGARAQDAGPPGAGAIEPEPEDSTSTTRTAEFATTSASPSDLEPQLTQPERIEDR